MLAFPRPKKFVTIFIEISSFACLLFFSSGNKNLIKGLNALFKIFIKLVFFTISIIPFHKQIVPKKVRVKLTAEFIESKIPLLAFSILPDSKAYIIEIIIKIGQIIFNKKSPHFLFISKVSFNHIRINYIYYI